MIRNALLTGCALGLTLLGGTGPAPAPVYVAAPPEPVAFSLTIQPAGAPLRAGGPVTAIVSAKLEPGWHVYGIEDLPNGPRPLRIVFPAKSAFTGKGAPVCTEPERDMDDAFGQVTSFYKTEFSCRANAGVASGVAAGAHGLTVEISFQACDGKMCLPARIVSLTKTVTVVR